ncbi:hypothetical protein C7M84_025472 [Penaeus vannamei]|uniref:Uncharacterized protein n=1 Tax=Penaeus vannamei TaxID=6689 RepID=A0A3R7MFQ6_PENVA|nr:hypothetical protein C7M84_025472 [Penaeus vannamei]
MVVEYLTVVEYLPVVGVAVVFISESPRLSVSRQKKNSVSESLVADPFVSDFLRVKPLRRREPLVSNPAVSERRVSRAWRRGGAGRVHGHRTSKSPSEPPNAHPRADDRRTGSPRQGTQERRTTHLYSNGAPLRPNLSSFHILPPSPPHTTSPPTFPPLYAPSLSTLSYPLPTLPTFASPIPRLRLSSRHPPFLLLPLLPPPPIFPPFFLPPPAHSPTFYPLPLSPTHLSYPANPTPTFTSYPAPPTYLVTPLPPWFLPLPRNAFPASPPSLHPPPTIPLSIPPFLTLLPTHTTQPPAPHHTTHSSSVPLHAKHLSSLPSPLYPPNRTPHHPPTPPSPRLLPPSHPPQPFLSLPSHLSLLTLHLTSLFPPSFFGVLTSHPSHLVSARPPYNEPRSRYTFVPCRGSIVTLPCLLLPFLTLSFTLFHTFLVCFFF